MRMRRACYAPRMRITAVLLAALALVACSAASQGALQDREWKLVSAGTFDGTPEGVSTPTVWFDRDGRFASNTGCNSAGAAYTLDGDRITIRQIAVTKRACAAAEGNRLENAVLQAIEKTRRYRVTNDQLELLGDDGTVLARFR